MPDKTFDIREVNGNHIANLKLASYAFVSSPQVPDQKKIEEYLNRRHDDRVLFSYINDEPVAKVGIIPMTQNVRGNVMTMGGISAVASMPVARRGGHIRALMTRSIEQMHADGQAVSALYPFKTSYYEKFGYAGWQLPLWVRLTPSALAPYLAIEKHGTVQQRQVGDAHDEFQEFYRAAQAQTHGMSHLPRSRTEAWFKEHPAWFMSVHENDAITGGISYKLDLDKNIMEVQFAYWSTTNGKLHVLDFMARHVDQVKQIRMPLRENQYPNLMFSDDGETTILSNEEYSWGAPMGRIVTLAGLNGIPVGDAEATISVIDQQAPWNTGTWTLSGRSGELQVTEGGDPGGEVHIAGLSAMLYSGLDPLTLPFRGWGSVESETAAALQELFPPVMPSMHEQF